MVNFQNVRLLVTFVFLTEWFIAATGFLNFDKPHSTLQNTRSLSILHQSLASIPLADLGNDQHNAPIVALSASSSASTRSSPSNGAITGKASSLASSINLMKNCVGSGVLSLNGRVNTLSPTMAFYPHIFALVFLIGSWAIHNFYIVGETVRLTGKLTFTETWAAAVEDTETNTKSLVPQSFVTFVITCAPIVSCIANTIVLTDVFKMLFRAAGVSASIYNNRTIVVALLTSLVLYPLCTVENLSGLKNISLLGLAGHMLTVLVMWKRSLDGTYLPGGVYHATAQWAANKASTATSSGFFSGPVSNWFIFASLLSYCQVAHYNVPRYYHELANPTNDRFGFLKMVSTSYLSAASIYCLTIFVTFRLFANKGQSFSLNTFSPQDPLAIFAYFAFGTSVLASFPLLFLNVRNWFYRQTQAFVPTIVNYQQKLANQKNSSRKVPERSSQEQGTNTNPSTTSSVQVVHEKDKEILIQKYQNFFSIKTVAAILLSSIGFVATKLTDIGKIGSVAGAIFGSSMMFIFPPIMYMSILKKKGASVDGLSAQQIQRKLWLNRILLGMGIGLGCMGTVNSVLALFRK